jgi:hypothetical protein
MKNRCLPLLVCLMALGTALGAAPGKVDAYRVFFARAELPGGEARIAIREFQRRGQRCLLLVDPQTLATEIVPASSLRISVDGDWRREFAGTPYVRVIDEATQKAQKLLNAGITHSLPAERGISLTIDLCPSRKPLDRFLFRDILAAFEKVERPVPLAIAVSGLWMEQHASDLHWLAGLAASGRIAVDWINHSYHHQYDPRLPLRRNFLLEKGVDLDQEVLLTEQKMIACGLVPSIFFRFPGLVSDEREFSRVLALGLVPVGSDAWLAKSQSPRYGSIVLIHGNGNEQLGIRRFLALVGRERAAIKKKNWLLFDLRDSAEPRE